MYCPRRENAAYLITGGGDGKVKIWDAIERKEKSVLEGIGKRLTCIAVSTGKYDPLIIAAAGDSMIKVWDGESGKEKITFKGKSASRLALLPGAKKLLSDLTIWDLAGDDEPVTLSAEKAFVGVSPDGKIAVALNGMGRITTYDLETQKILGGQNNEPARLNPLDCTFSPDGRTVVYGGMGGMLHIWNIPERSDKYSN